MPAAQVVALPLMGIVPEPSWTLPQRADAIIMMMSGTSQAVPPATAPAAAPVTTPLTGNGDDTGNGSGGGSSGAGKRKASSSASRQVSSTPPPQPSRQPCVHSSRLRSSPSRCSTALLLQRVHPEAEGAAEGTTHRGRGRVGRGGHGRCGTVGRTYSWGYSSLLWSQILAHILNVRYS